MSVFEIKRGHNLIFYQPSKNISANEILNFLNQVVQHPEYQDDMLEFIDLSYVSKWDIQYDDIQAILTSQASKGIKAKKVKKTGILASTDISYGIARMYQTLAKSFGVEVFISRNRDDVLNYLEVNKDIKLISITAQ